MGVLLFADRCFERERVLGDFQGLAYLFERHVELGKLLRRRLAANLVEYLPPRAQNLVDDLDHVNGYADGARLIRERAADRLPDPPGGVGGKLVSAPILELVDRLHQADVALLDQVEELQAAVGVFFRDRDDEAQIGLDHFLLGLTGLALALLHGVHDLAELADLETGELGKRMNLAADVLDAILLDRDKILP